MSEQKRESAWPKYPFESFPWDDSPSNNNRWVDAAEAEKAYDKLAAENEWLKEEFTEAVRSIIGHFFFVDPNTDEPYYDSMCMSDGEEYLQIAIEMGLIDKKQVRRI